MRAPILRALRIDLQYAAQNTSLQQHFLSLVAADRRFYILQASKRPGLSAWDPRGLLSRSRSCISLGVPPANAVHTLHKLVCDLCRAHAVQVLLAACIIHAFALQCLYVGLFGDIQLPGSLLLSQLGIQLPVGPSVSAEKLLRVAQLPNCKAGDHLLTCIHACLPIMLGRTIGVSDCSDQVWYHLTDVSYAVTYLGLCA